MSGSPADLVVGKMYRVVALRVQFIREAVDGTVIASVTMPEESYRARGVPHTFDGVFRAHVGSSVLQFQVSGYYMAFVVADAVTSVRRLDRE